MRDTEEPIMNLQEALQHAVHTADKSFEAYRKRQMNALTPELIDKLREDTDLHPNDNNPLHLERHTQQQQEMLHALFADVTTPESFYKTCLGYIDEQVDELFFIHNHLPDAYNARDYLRHTLNVVVPFLEAAGHLNKAQATRINYLTHYFDIHLEAYRALREEIAEQTDNKTRSLVSAALGSVDTHKLADRHLRLLKTDPLQLHEKERDYVRSRSHALFDEFIESAYPFGVEEEGQALPPITIWMGRRAYEIAGRELLSAGMSPKHASAQELHGRIKARAFELLQAWNEIVQHEEDPVLALCDMHVAIDEAFAKAARQPQDFREILAACAKNAKDNMPARLQAEREEILGKMDMAVPRSQREIVGKLWSPTNTAETAESAMKVVADLLHKNTRRAGTMEGLIEQLEIVVDTVGHRTFFSFMDPTALVAVRDCITDLRRDLGAALHESGHFDAQARNLARMRKLENKCGFLTESLMLTKKGMLRSTQGAYDDPFYMAVAQFAAEEGRTLSQMTPDEHDKELLPRSYHNFVNMLGEHGADYHEYGHLLMPLIYAECQKIAAAKIGRAPTLSRRINEDDEHVVDVSRNENYLVRLETETRQCFYDAIDRVCKNKDALAAGKEPDIQMDAESCHRLFAELERQKEAARSARH